MPKLASFLETQVQTFITAILMNIA